MTCVNEPLYPSGTTHHRRRRTNTQDGQTGRNSTPARNDKKKKKNYSSSFGLLLSFRFVRWFYSIFVAFDSRGIYKHTHTHTRPYTCHYHHDDSNLEHHRRIKQIGGIVRVTTETSGLSDTRWVFPLCQPVQQISRSGTTRDRLHAALHIPLSPHVHRRHCPWGR